MSQLALGRPFFGFLSELGSNNDRAWFTANAARYARDVEAPFLALLGALVEPLATIAPAIACIPTRTRGSMMRLQRDTRFSRDKSPYKVHVAAMLLHRSTPRGAGMLGYLLHLGADAAWLGAGVSSPPADALGQIREAIAAPGSSWGELRVPVEGEQLKRIPSGFDAAHPFEADLRRKSFFAQVPLDRRALERDAVEPVVTAATELAPLLRFLTEAQTLHWT